MGWFLLAALAIWIIYSIFSERSESKPLRPVAQDKNQWDGDIDGKGIAAGSSWDITRKAIFARDKYTCQSCGRKDNLTVDHIVQLSHGGTNNPENLQTLCKYCHEKKDNKKIFNKSFNHDSNYGAAGTSNSTVVAIEHAIKTSTTIKIAYTDINNRTTYREISPKHFTKEHGIPYLVAFCHLRNDKRTFRLSRLRVI